MKFCDECGSMMKSGEGEDHWVCTACGYEVGRDDDDEAVWTTESQVESEVVDVSDAEDKGLPTTTAQCPECDNDRAYWYMHPVFRLYRLRAQVARRRPLSGSPNADAGCVERRRRDRHECAHPGV
jgi:DNA-directed RNA polymerase subunit M